MGFSSGLKKTIKKATKSVEYTAAVPTTVKPSLSTAPSVPSTVKPSVPSTVKPSVPTKPSESDTNKNDDDDSYKVENTTEVSSWMYTVFFVMILILFFGIGIIAAFENS